MDIKSLEERSKNMAAIHSKNTKPEIYLRKLLFARGYRYGVNSKSVLGHPDIYMRKYNTAIFVHGCFWHRHEGCKYAYVPKSRIEFWQKKFDANIKRDKTVRKELLELKIKQLIIWECTIKKMKKDEIYRDKIAGQIIDFLVSRIIFWKFKLWHDLLKFSFRDHADFYLNDREANKSVLYLRNNKYTKSGFAKEGVS